MCGEWNVWSIAIATYLACAGVIWVWVSVDLLRQERYLQFGDFLVQSSAGLLPILLFWWYFAVSVAAEFLTHQLGRKPKKFFFDRWAEKVLSYPLRYR